ETPTKHVALIFPRKLVQSVFIGTPPLREDCASSLPGNERRKCRFHSVLCVGECAEFERGDRLWEVTVVQSNTSSARRWDAANAAYM
ncbi:MAG: hypothetical protein WA744_18570, partial [Candidatus Acidiferrales bacterium]